MLAGLLCVSLLGGTWSPQAQAQVNLPALGDTASEDFNLGTERHLGDAIMRDIRRDPDYLAAVLIALVILGYLFL